MRTDEPIAPETEPIQPFMKDGQSLGGLIVEITQDFSKLIRKEVELARQEATDLLKEKVMAVALIAIGAVLGLLLVPFVMFTIYKVLALFMPEWVAAVTITLVIAAACGAVFMVAKSKLGGKMAPERTIKTLKEDVEWAKNLKK
ncbi:MAG: phage holin family protein [Actinomycetota bacterium]